MKKVYKFFNYLFCNPKKILLVLLIRLASILPDKFFLQCRFALELGYKLDLENPQTFCEKLQWLKLYNRKDEYTKMVDKYLVKDYVKDLIGEEYIIPTLGVWNSFDEIDFNLLPNQFVLKTTNGGGGTGVVICKDKVTFDIETTRKKIIRSLNTSVYNTYKEWPYKNIKGRIIAEKFMMEDVSEANPQGDLVDYKFFCFSGEVKAILIATNRYSRNGVCFDYFDKNFNIKKYLGGIWMKKR